MRWRGVMAFKVRVAVLNKSSKTAYFFLHHRFQSHVETASPTSWWIRGGDLMRQKLPFNRNGSIYSRLEVNSRCGQQYMSSSTRRLTGINGNTLFIVENRYHFIRVRIQFWVQTSLALIKEAKASWFISQVRRLQFKSNAGPNYAITLIETVKPYWHHLVLDECKIRHFRKTGKLLKD